MKTTLYIKQGEYCLSMLISADIILGIADMDIFGGMADIYLFFCEGGVGRRWR